MTFQYCGPGHHGGSLDCAPASSCWVGSFTATSCHHQPHWQGSARHPLPPNPSPSPSPAPRPPSSGGGAKAWLKLMADGSHALLLLNPDSDERHIAVTWSELGLGGAGSLQVRDLWARKELGKFTDAFGV